LVTTAITLESTGNYLVTYIPDCAKWKNAANLVQAIARLFGSERWHIVEMNKDWSDLRAENNLEELIDAISNCLAKMNPPKQWLFVFDQINTLFTKGNLRETDIPVLSFPFCTIRTVMRQGRVISVISASANNEAPIAGKLDGFVEYNHPMTMTTEDLLLGFTALVDDNGCPNEDLLETTISLTNGVPLYASLFFG
jgi:hypothetical protein